MIQITPAPLFPLAYTKPKQWVILEDVIMDRGSRYTVSVFVIQSSDDIVMSLGSLDKMATHHSYARRLLQHDGSIHCESNDDGETWAGQIILRELERRQMADVLLVVTRYFGWVKLEADRYTHIVNACKMGLDRVIEFGL